MKKYELNEPRKNDLGWYVEATTGNLYYLNKEGTVGSWKSQELGYWKTKEEAEKARQIYLGEYKMKKSDLKTGMLVECRNGEVRLVLGATLLAAKTGGGISLDYINEDLTRKNGNKHDIVKVYSEPVQAGGLCADLTWWVGSNFEKLLDKSNLLWECKEQVEEMTLEEVCKLLGKDIKIVKG